MCVCDLIEDNWKNINKKFLTPRVAGWNIDDFYFLIYKNFLYCLPYIYQI